MKPITLSLRHPAAYKAPAIEKPPQARPQATLGLRTAALMVAAAIGLATFQAQAAPPYMEVNGRVVVEARGDGGERSRQGNT